MLDWRSQKMLLAAGALSLIAAFSPGAAAQQTHDAPAASTQPSAAAKPEPAQAAHLRVVEDKGKFIALEIATREYRRADAAGPTIGLVGVAHIADKSFYRAVEKALKEYDIVLYESVKPPGTGGAGGETDEQRIDSTKAAMQFVGGLIEAHHAQRDTYPHDIGELEKFAAEQDQRAVQFLAIAVKDAWGRSLVYDVHAASGEAAAETYTLTSLGADGMPGGEGANADLALADHHPPDPLILSKDDGLQGQLASALGLEFQLDALPYDQANWRCSDMAMDELNRRFAAKGLDFDMIGGTLAGSSMPARVIKILLGFMKMADAFAEGAITDMFKVVLIEMLGDPAVLDQGLAQFGAGFSEVIVEDRNQVVIDDLKRVIEQEPQVRSIAILYGAAHMPDMARRLADQLDYQPGDESQDRWLTAIKVDLRNSKLSAADLNAVRATMKQAMRQQLRRR